MVGFYGSNGKFDISTNSQGDGTTGNMFQFFVGMIVLHWCGDLNRALAPMWKRFLQKRCFRDTPQNWWCGDQWNKWAQDASTTILYLKGAELKRSPRFMKQGFSCILSKIIRHFLQPVWPNLPWNRRRANTAVKAICACLSVNRGIKRLMASLLKMIMGSSKVPQRGKNHMWKLRGIKMALKVTACRVNELWQL